MFGMAIFRENLVELLGIFVAAFAVIYTYFKWSFNYWQRRNVVVPFKPTFPLGNFENPFKNEKGYLDVVVEAYQELKKRKLRYGGSYFLISPQLVIADPELLRLIMAKEAHIFNSRGLYYNDEKNPLEGHLFFISGDKWKQLRAKLTPTFTSGKMKMMFNILIECGDPLIESMENHLDQPLDIKDMLGNFTTDVIGSCAFGLQFSSFQSEESDFRKHGKIIFNTTLKIRLIGLFGTAFPELARKLGLDTMPKESVDFFMNVVKDNINFRQKNNYKRNDFFQLLMEIQRKSEEDGNEQSFTIGDFAAQAFVFFLAAFETSSTTMTFALYELAKHQDIQKRLRDEINEVLKRHDGKLTYDAIQEMKLLACVIDEALRMYPPGSVLGRVAAQDYKLPDEDLIIEKGVHCLIPVYGLHRDEEYFPDPNTFKPERFNEENKANIKPYTYMPFGEGPRNCIGLRFGLMQTKVGLALLLKYFEFFPCSKTLEPLRYVADSFVLAAKGEIWLTAKKVNNQARRNV